MSGFIEVRPGLLQLSLPPLDIVNVFLIGDVLVDCGAGFSARRVLDALEDRQVAALVLTHGHFDHQGAAHTICDALEIPLWCSDKERESVESGDFMELFPDPKTWIAKFHQYMAGPAHSVSQGLSEGDRIGEFTVIATPGHTPGHISFWRPDDRALILGDVLFNRNPLTFRTGLQEPFSLITSDPSTNRESARKVAALKPSVVCFGHGKPLANSERFISYVSQLSNE